MLFFVYPSRLTHQNTGETGEVYRNLAETHRSRPCLRSRQKTPLPRGPTVMDCPEKYSNRKVREKVDVSLYWYIGVQISGTGVVINSEVTLPFSPGGSSTFQVNGPVLSIKRFWDGTVLLLRNRSHRRVVKKRKYPDTPPTRY